jgi:hypothetical protein
MTEDEGKFSPPVPFGYWILGIRPSSSLAGCREIVIRPSSLRQDMNHVLTFKEKANHG